MQPHATSTANSHFEPSAGANGYNTLQEQKMSQTQSYKGLPQMAGLCTIEEAMKPGLSVEECVRRHKRYHYAFKRLHQITNARITAEPIYELKTIFSLHSHLCAEHTTALRER